jgi:cysteine-rich repeat protein
LDAFLDISTAGTIDNSGGWDASWVEMYAGRDVTVTGRIDSRGRVIGGVGGSVVLGAGEEGKGRLWVQNTVDAGGGTCSVEAGCGGGGTIDLGGCDVTLTSAGSLLVRASQGGDILVVAREQMTLQGRLDATTTTPGQQYAFDGTNTINHPVPKPPSITGPVVPAATINALAMCTGSPPWTCMMPCPTCGNGVIEYPETCDTAGTPQSCDGCSVYCRVENCNDTSACTTDSCDLRLGCRWFWITCADGNPCTMDYCNYGTGTCVHSPISNPPACP